MKNSTINNTIQRHDWLQEIIERRMQLPDNQLYALENLQAFCKSSIPNRFDEISYNSLKKSADTALIEKLANTDIANGWDYLKELFERAKKIAKPIPATTTNKSKSFESINQNSAWTAHLCSLAYFDLIKRIELAAKTHNIDNEFRFKLSIIIDESLAKFESIVSPYSAGPDTTPFSVISGGRS